MKHHKQMIRGSIPSLEKLRAAAGKRAPQPDVIVRVPPLTEAERNIDRLRPVDYAGIAQDSAPFAGRGWLRDWLHRAMVRFAAWFRRRVR